MRGQTSLTHSRTLGKRLALIFAASALTLTLALGGCRSGARGQTIQQTQGGASSDAGAGSTTSSNSAALQQLQSIDDQNQSDAQQLDATQSGASVNYASQESQTQP